MIGGILRALLWLASLAVLAATAIPLSRSDAWWVRALEFPRVYLLGTALLLAGAGIAVLSRRTGRALAALLLLAAAWQASWVWRYAPWTPVDVEMAGGAGTVSVLSANLLQSNDDHAAARALIAREDPDVLLLMEVSPAWRAALAEVIDAYPQVAERPDDDHYGMVLATRLPVERLELRQLEGDTIPMGTMLATAPGGGRFALVALHPRPPVPSTGGEALDRQMRMAAELATGDGLPALVVGDFNDVAWSRTSQRLRDRAGLRDPRVGRGVRASFDLRSWWLRLPLDQALLTDGVRLHGWDLLEPGGSDHRPLRLRVSIPADG